VPFETSKLVELVKRFEGFRGKPYICPAGYWTIGYGVLCQRDHPEITQDEAEAMLAKILPGYIAHALRLSPGLVEHPDRLTAISDFIFNLGPTRYAASTLRKRVNDGAWEEAKGEIRKWVYGGARKLPGLVLRREAEAALL
jgi:lysozyme